MMNLFAPPILAQENALSDTLSASMRNVEAISEEMESMAREVMSGDIFITILGFARGLSVIALVFFAYQLMRQLNENRTYDSVGSLIAVFLTLLLLAGNGTLLFEMNWAARNTINSISEKVMQASVDNVTLKEVYRTSLIAETTRDALELELGKCEGRANDEDRLQCRQEVAAKGRALLDTAVEEATPWITRNIQGTWLGDSWVGRIVQTIDVASASSILERGFFSTIGLAFLRIVLISLHSGFQFLLEISIIILGVLSPLAVALLPFPQIGMQAFMTLIRGYISVGMAKVSFNLISAMIAYIALKASAFEVGLIIPILMGIFSPMLAIAIATGNNLIFLSSLQYPTAYMSFMTTRLLTSAAAALPRAAMRASKRPRQRK